MGKDKRKGVGFSLSIEFRVMHYWPLGNSRYKKKFIGSSFVVISIKATVSVRLLYGVGDSG